MFRNLVTRFFPWLVYLSLFLLPWQTRYIYDQKLIAGAPFEYGTMSVYAVELLIILAFFVGQRLNIRREHQASVKAMGILLVASAVSIMFSRNVDLSFGAWSHLLFATLLFVLVLDQRVDRWKALQAFSLGLISPAVLGFFSSFFWYFPSVEMVWSCYPSCGRSRNGSGRNGRGSSAPCLRKFSSSQHFWRLLGDWFAQYLIFAVAIETNESLADRRASVFF